MGQAAQSVKRQIERRRGMGRIKIMSKSKSKRTSYIGAADKGPSRTGHRDKVDDKV